MTDTAKDADQFMQRFRDVALIDPETAAAIGMVSLSWWFREVHEGRAPKPVWKDHKITRYRMVDVIEFWKDIGNKKTEDLNEVAPVEVKRTHRKGAKPGPRKKSSLSCVPRVRGGTVVTQDAVYNKYAEMFTAEPRRIATRVSVANELGVPYALVDDHTRRLIRSGLLKRVRPGVFVPAKSAAASTETP